MEATVKYAINPKTNKRVTPEQFIESEGMRHKERGVYPFCPKCNQPLIIYGVNSPSVEARFQHEKNSPDCPLKYENDRHFTGLLPSERSEYEANELKKEFYDLDNLKGAYAVCHRMCGAGGLSSEKFSELLALADKKQIWKYADFTIEIAPYILVTLDDFEAIDRNKQPYSFRFLLIKDNVIDENCDIGHICSKPDECRLRKIFCDSKKEITTFRIPDPRCEMAKNNTDKIAASILAKLKELSMDT
jgi:hypothetical protein